jgi:ADP-ribosylglycohydrolase
MSHDRIVGCLLGGAIGDAMGGPHEGKPPPVDPCAGGPWRLSDDTQLTLATCEAVVDAGRVDPSAIASAFLAWFRGRRLTGIGASTWHALNGLAAGGHWALVGRKGEMAAGNGAAMRIAPLAFLCDPAERADRLLIRDVCRITHHNDEAYAGALAVVLAVRALAPSGPGSPSPLASIVAERLPDCRVRERLSALAGLPAGTGIPAVAERYGCSGYVAHTVPLAVYAAQQYPALGFEEILAAVIASGGDTDTNASIAGQILGAATGLSGLPAHLVCRVPGLEDVRRRAEAYAAAVERGA